MARPQPHDDADDADDKLRLDKWLWAARFFKTRSLAAEAIAGGKVEVNDERPKRARALNVGDTVRVRHGAFEHTVVVRALSARRGGAAEAQTLYEETAESRKARETLAEQHRLAAISYGADRGRPNKKDRREIERFRSRD